MDVTPAPPVTSGRAIARDIARQAKAAAQQARIAAQDEKNGTARPVIAGQDGHTATTAPPLSYDANNVIPPQAVDISVAFFLMVAFCVVGFPLARAFARRMDRRTEFKSVPGPDLTPQIRQLQESVDAMAIEMERISEGQRFTAKLLADRSGVAAQNK
jgi:hypothetical protein